MSKSSCSGATRSARWSASCFRVVGFGIAFCAAISSAAVIVSWIAHASGNQVLLRISWDILGVGTAALLYPALPFSQGSMSAWMFVLPVLFWGMILEAAFRIIWPKLGLPNVDITREGGEDVTQVSRPRRFRRPSVSVAVSVFVLFVAALFVRESRRPISLPSSFQTSFFRLDHVQRDAGVPLLGIFEFTYPNGSVARTFPGVSVPSGQEFVPGAVEYEIRNGAKWQPVGAELKSLSGPAFTLSPGSTYQMKVDLSPLVPFAGTDARISIRSKDAARFVSRPFRIGES